MCRYGSLININPSGVHVEGFLQRSSRRKKIKEKEKEEGKAVVERSTSMYLVEKPTVSC